MTKTELYTSVTDGIKALLAEHKTSKKFQDELLTIIDTNLKLKVRGSEFPDILDENGAIEQVYCIRHEKYEPAADMSKKANGEYYNRCIYSTERYREISRTVKKAKDSVTKKFMLKDPDVIALQAELKSADELLETRTVYPYDYEADVEAYNARNN